MKERDWNTLNQGRCNDEWFEQGVKATVELYVMTATNNKGI